MSAANIWDSTLRGLLMTIGVSNGFRLRESRRQSAMPSDRKIAVFTPVGEDRS
jgi:hypothetical protein